MTQFFLAKKLWSMVDTSDGFTNQLKRKMGSSFSPNLAQVETLQKCRNNSKDASLMFKCHKHVTRMLGCEKSNQLLSDLLWTNTRKKNCGTPRQVSSEKLLTSSS